MLQTDRGLISAHRSSVYTAPTWKRDHAISTPTALCPKSYVYERVNTGQLKPKIAKTFRFEEVVEAYEYMESNEQIGKIVLTVGE